MWLRRSALIKRLHLTGLVSANNCSHALPAVGYNAAPLFSVVIMEYEFTFDAQGQPCAVFSSGHSAFGCWLTDELSANAGQLAALINVVAQLEAKALYEHDAPGKSFSLLLDRERAVVSANSLALDMAELETDAEIAGSTDFYDEELYAECGLTDFKAALLSWQLFLQP